MKFGEIISRFGGNFDQISAISSESPRWPEVFSHEFVLLRHQILVRDRVAASVSSKIEIEVWYEPQSDIVFWPSPPQEIYPRLVLFSSFNEFAQWIAWRLQAKFRLTTIQTDRIAAEIEGLRVKLTSPSKAATLQDGSDEHMTSDMDLL